MIKYCVITALHTAYTVDTMYVRMYEISRSLFSQVLDQSNQNSQFCPGFQHFILGAIFFQRFSSEHENLITFAFDRPNGITCILFRLQPVGYAKTKSID